MDSDFSIDENDEPVSDQDEENQRSKRKRAAGVVTKSYREPTKKPVAKSTRPAMKQPSPKKPQPRSPHQRKFTIHDSGRMSFRKSTAMKTAATQIRLKQRNEENKKKKKLIKIEEYIPTQEELLEEAMETEKENLKSLEKFQRLELEKKKTRPTKRQFSGPVIRYHSTSLPRIEDLDGRKIDLSIADTSPVKSEPLEVDSEEVTTPRPKPKRKPTQRSLNALKNCPRYERTFITFENDLDEKLFADIFKKTAPRKREDTRSRLCPITKLPAKYFDPVTKLPYRSLAAFRIIREAYYRQLEEKGNPENPDVAKWIQWRKTYKEQKLKT